MRPVRRLFRGSELPRLLFLVAIVAAGWPMVGLYAPPAPGARPAPAADRDRAADRRPTPASSSRRSRQDADRVPRHGRLRGLLERARETPPADLAAQADANMPLHPPLGAPRALSGRARPHRGDRKRVLDLRGQPRAGPAGQIYEAWVFTYENQTFPYVLIFEEPPAGFPGGPDVSTGDFDGYFLKLLAYQAGDIARAAPMLVGRLRWKPNAQESPGDSAGKTLRWAILGMSVMTIYGLVRWGLHLRRKLAPTRRRPIGPRPNDEIAPEALTEWLEESEPDPDDFYRRRDDDDEP